MGFRPFCLYWGPFTPESNDWIHITGLLGICATSLSMEAATLDLPRVKYTHHNGWVPSPPLDFRISASLEIPTRVCWDLTRVKVFRWFELNQGAPLSKNLEPFLLHIPIALSGIFFSTSLFFKFSTKKFGFFSSSVNSTKISQILGKFSKISIA